jgi:hypothetical protein
MVALPCGGRCGNMVGFLGDVEAKLVPGSSPPYSIVRYHAPSTDRVTVTKHRDCLRLSRWQWWIVILFVHFLTNSHHPSSAYLCISVQLDPVHFLQIVQVELQLTTVVGLHQEHNQEHIIKSQSSVCDDLG